MQFLIKVRDVNGGVLSPTSLNARYDRLGPAGQIEQIAHRLIPGQVNSLPLASPSVLFAIAVDNFIDETITIMEAGGRWLSDSPAGSVAQDGDLVTLEVTVGCVSLAPTITLPPNALVKNNPRAALVDPADGWMYRDAWLNPENIHRLDDPIDFRDPAAPGWERFRYKSVPVDLKSRGSYVLLEYGREPEAQGSRDPRFLIAVWVPRVALGATPQVLVFYTPPTKPVDFPADSYPFRGQYPYAAYVTVPKPPPPAAEVHPPYTGLAVRYLISGYKIIYQLLAAGRNPIVIMPIHPSTNWGPLASQRGLCRLVKEVVRFLYARQLVSSRNTPSARFTLSGGRASVFPSRRLFTDEAIAQDWAVTIAGFSNGIDKVLDLCTKETFDDKLYPSPIFDAPPGPLLSSWREIWDIDGVADDGAGAQRHLETLRTWLKTSRRNVRSYHSDTGARTQPRALLESSRIESRPKAPINGVVVEQGTSADGRTTWVHFSNSALKLSDDDAHKTVIAVAFGHAAQFPLP